MNVKGEGEGTPGLDVPSSLIWPRTETSVTIRGKQDEEGLQDREMETKWRMNKGKEN